MTIEEMLAHPAWIAVAGEDRDWLNLYANYIFAQIIKRNLHEDTDHAMAFQIMKDVKQDQLRVLYLNSVQKSSTIGGTSKFNTFRMSPETRFIGVEPKDEDDNFSPKTRSIPSGTGTGRVK